MPNKNSSYWIEKLKLKPHPEGGWYKEVYRSDKTIRSKALSNNFTGNRNLSTAIYFLLERGDFSAFHRIKSDEIWHFYDGDILEIVEINPSGKLTVYHHGLDAETGAFPQVVIKAGNWFAARPLGGYALVGCTVSPGFDFKDFEMASKTKLIAQFPQHKAILNELCRG